MKLKTAFAAALLAPAAVLHGGTTEQSGRILSADTPIAFSTVALYQAGDKKGSGEVVLGSAVADMDGFFTIAYTPPRASSAVLYLVANGPDPTTRLVTVLGIAPFPDQVTINERTTVATAHAMAQFIVDGDIGGKSPGLQNAAGMFRNLVNLANGDLGTALVPPRSQAITPSSTTPEFVAVPMLNSLANMLARCVTTPVDCAELFILATPPGGTTPANTLQVAVNIAHFPWQNHDALFVYSQVFTPYQPDRSTAPATWTLAIKFVGNGRQFDGPGAIAFQENGDLWVNNNYIFRFDHTQPTCGDDTFFKLTATGANAPGSPFNGAAAGLNGAGFGISLDHHGNVWFGNYGFFGYGCPCDLYPVPANSVTKVGPDGMPISPSTGYTQGCITAAQAVVPDRAGNIWIANMCGGTVTQYSGGDPDDNWVYDIETDSHLTDTDPCPGFLSDVHRPFAIAIDAEGDAWVSATLCMPAGLDVVIQLSPDGSLLTSLGAADGINRPMGVACDSAGSVWISNSAVVVLPCVECAPGAIQDLGGLQPDFDNASITQVDAATGNVIGTYQGGGLWIPWGIAVDGDDNIWIANFGGFRVSHFDGATGVPIAPDGYVSMSLQRNTGVSIDTAGNVWLTNNWLLDAPLILSNPGGDGLVVFIGLAAPVKPPLIGPVQRP